MNRHVAKSSVQKPARLFLQRLEDRTTPATASYDALTQTLTIVAADTDQIGVSNTSGDPASYITVTDTASTVFRSADLAQPVRNLIVDFDGVDTGDLWLKSTLKLGGNVTVFGARSSQLFRHTGTVSGNIKYLSSGTATDHAIFIGASRVGGNVKLGLGAGDNTVELRGGYIGGNLAVNGGKGIDTVRLVEVTDLTVGGSAAFRLGHGLNQLLGVDTHIFDVGKSLTYVGGMSDDVITLGDNLMTLRVGNNAAFRLGDATPAGTNFANFGPTQIGGNLAFTGSAHDDEIEFDSDLSVGGNLSASLGDGTNYLNFNFFANAVNTIGGNLNYLGGDGWDDVALDAMTIGRNATIDLGDSPSGAQKIRVAPFSASENRIYGSFTVMGGSKDDYISLRRLYVGNGMTILTGADDDEIEIDDVDVAGQTLIQLGDGSDSVKIETIAGDAWGNLDDDTTFGGKFTVRAGAGDDLVNFSKDMDPTTFPRFGGKVSLVGGDGDDTLDVEGYPWSVTGNFSDFETGSVP